VDDKADDRDGDGRIGYVEGRPWIGITNMQIDQEKIDDVTVPKSIGQISQNPGQK
jgi:hypothetical protein